MTTRRAIDIFIIALSIATLVTLGSAAKRRFVHANGSDGPPVRKVADWRTYVEGRMMALGSPNERAAVIVEFADFQCPYCARFAHVLDTVAARVPNGIRLYFRHLPLQSHAYAHSAAVAS